MVKQTVIQTYHRILFSNFKKAQTTATVWMNIQGIMLNEKKKN